MLRHDLGPSPAVAAPFLWRESEAGQVLVCGPLEAYARHVFTTRQLRFRDASIAEDYERLARALGLDSAAGIGRVRQVHGRGVRVLHAGEHADGDAEADVLVSLDPSRAISVRIADCVPILLAARRAPVVAAVHAGWRGTAAGAARAAVEAVAALGVPAGDLVAAMGPSIGPCCYQIDERVRTAFLAMTPDAAGWMMEDGPGHWKLDLWRANREQLIEAGVPAEAIFAAALCTADHPEVCWSHRRDGAAAGRMVAAVRARGAGLEA